MRASPKTAKGQATRGRIIAAATDLVAARGVHVTSLDDVLAAAAVSKSQLYHYFEDKADLMQAVVEATTTAVLDAQQPHLQRLESWTAIRQWFDALVDLQRARQARGGCPIGSLVPELAEVDNLRDELARSFDRWQGHLADGLRAIAARGSLVDGADPDSLAVATMAAIQGGLLLTQVRRDPEQLRVALDAAYDHLRAQTRE
jgi:TetR/AcrR family transcriptional regulator, transcriptional repressor for nem operon